MGILVISSFLIGGGVWGVWSFFSSELEELVDSVEFLKLIDEYEYFEVC